MVLSPLGAEVDVSGAESITYQFASGPRSVAPGFKVFFPDLAGKPVKVGDTWPSSFVIEDKGGRPTCASKRKRSTPSRPSRRSKDGVRPDRLQEHGTISGPEASRASTWCTPAPSKGPTSGTSPSRKDLCPIDQRGGERDHDHRQRAPVHDHPGDQTRKSEVKLAGR